MLTIGMPRALVHYDCSDVWVKFFESLGAAVAVSPETTKDIVDIGVSLSVEDACLPVKVYVGHAAYMAKRCDYLFVPRLVSLEPRTYMCPKFLGLPDMVRAALRDSVRLIDPTIDLSRSARAMAQAVARAASCLSKDPARSMPVWRSCLRSDAVCGTEAAGRGEAAGGGEAVGRAAALFADKDDCRRSADCDKPAGCEVGTARENGIRLRIGLLSHPYIISDRVLSRAWSTGSGKWECRPSCPRACSRMPPSRISLSSGVTSSGRTRRGFTAQGRPWRQNHRSLESSSSRPSDAVLGR